MKNLSHSIVGFLGVAALAQTGCSGGDVCGQWTVEIAQLGAGGTASAEIRDGALVLSETGVTGACVSESLPCKTVKVFADGIAGDFEATFRLEGFTGDGNGAEAVAFAAGSAPGDEVRGGILVDDFFSVPLFFAADPSSLTGQGADTQRVAVTIERTGDLVVVVSVPDDPDASDPPTISWRLGTSPLRLGMAITSGPASAGTTSIRVTDFTITGGGGAIASDAFDCGF